ncbi:MAG: SurA N-terminal domain-containing protein [Bacteroidales bacterium]|nr:SurA N-terminal domain-containing protein [Bacteroidales bacterium]
MAVLQKLRTKFGLAISILVALGLLSFIIDPSQIQSAVQSMSSKYDVGSINGKAISYTDFQADVEKFTRLQEIMTGSSVSSEEDQKQVRDAAWQTLVDKYLFVKTAKAAGLTVGEDEVIDLTTGSNISPVIAQNAMFLDENGNFDANRVVEFVKAMGSDESGSYRLYWNYIQNTIFTQQFYNKYGALFTASNFQNPLMLNRAIAENNQTADVDFVMVPLLYSEDSTIVVSSDEIKNYYNSHKDFFKQTANREMEYVVYEVTPSSDDIAVVNTEMSDIYDDFVNTDNMKNFLLKNSDRSLSSYWYKADELNSLSSELGAFVNENTVGAVSPVYQNGNSFYAAKIMAETKRPETISVRVIPTTETAVSDSLVAVLRLSETMDMTQSYLIPGCEPLFDAALNVPQMVQSLQYGTLLAEVVEKSEPVLMKQVAILEKTVVPSNETYNNIYAKANKFATIASGSYNNYKAAVDSMGVYSYTNRITEATSAYGAIDNAKEVTRWVFEAKEGKPSEVIIVNQNYFFVAVVTGIHKEGYAKLSEVASSIKNQLYSEKAAEKLASDVASKIQGLNDLESIAEALNTTVSSQSGVTFAALGASTLDPKFIGAIASAPEGKICGPVAGSIGSYVFQVKGRDTGSYYTEDDAALYESQKNQYNSQMLLSVMMNDADVKDNRARFY